MSLEAVVSIDSGTGPRHISLTAYLDPEREEAAACETHAWIKSLRHARVDGATFRERFTYRGDSLWWFAELYLHKERTILSLVRAAHAVEALIERERPLVVRLVRGSRIVRFVTPRVAAARRVRYEGPRGAGAGWLRLGSMDIRSAALALTAMGSRRRPAAAATPRGITLAAFVHRAFWRTDTGDGSAESYIGPVLQALERTLPPPEMTYVGIGPATNFRARRWWRRPAALPDRVVPIEALVPRDSMSGSWQIWKSRHAVRRALLASDDLRRAAVIRGCDCWPIVAEALAGIALLQFPWSARAMDEAAAALDALAPRVALTYAEAGGWGRALALEARRRGIPLAGLQHGFIYRHWLNYRHEADEMQPAGAAGDAGFPRPALTLLFDEYAARHLVAAGRFPPESIAVTGSPRLDALAAAVSRLGPAAIDEARRDAGARPDQPLILIVSKHTEIRPLLPALIDAVREMPEVHAAIKTHPAEMPVPYEAAAAGVPNVRVLPADAGLAPLLRAARALVTVNSTVAIDALALGVPALSIGLPNNLSPFVAAGAMAGAASAQDIAPALQRVLYDEGFRQQLVAAGATFAAEYRIIPDGGAAERSAAAIRGLIH
jgi:hypothetical protein